MCLQFGCSLLHSVAHMWRVKRSCQTTYAFHSLFVVICYPCFAGSEDRRHPLKGKGKVAFVDNSIGSRISSALGEVGVAPYLRWDAP